MSVRVRVCVYLFIWKYNNNKIHNIVLLSLPLTLQSLIFYTIDKFD